MITEDRNTKQGSKEWHALRATRIGASEVAAIMKEDPYRSYNALLKQKKEKEKPYVTAAMSRGVLLEEQARTQFIKDTGLFVEPTLFYNDWQIASLDGFNREMGIIVEIKCPKPETHQIAVEGKVPYYYLLQMQHQFYLSGTKEGYYYSYDGARGVYVKVTRDDEIIDKMVAAEKAFYGEWMGADSFYDVRTDDFWREIADEIKKWDELEKMAKEKKEAAKEKAIACARCERTEGYGVRLVKSLSKGVVQYKNIPELKNIDLEQYRGNPVEKWTVTLV